MSPCFIPASASSSALPRPASVHTKASARSIASSSLYSIEDSLREIVGAVTVFNREQTDYCPGESSARNIDQLSGLSTAETPVTDTPPSPLPPPYREPRATASEFHLRIRELTEEAGAVVTDGPPVSARPTTPQRRAAVAPEHSIQGLVSALLAACTLRDDRRAKAKGKEKERAENDDSFDRGSSSRPHPRGNRRGGGFITPWTKKGSIRRTTIPIAQSENTLTTVAPKTQREEALAGQDLCRTIGPSDIVSVTFRASSGTEKTCWISLNVVDTWPKLLGFIRYASMPEMSHSETDSRHLVIEDFSHSPLTEDKWSPNSETRLASIHLQVSSNLLPSKPARLFTAITTRILRPIPPVSGASTDKNIGDSAMDSAPALARERLRGNAVFDVVAYPPDGLCLQINIRLLDDSLVLSPADCLVTHGGSAPDDDSQNVSWSLETVDSREFTLPEQYKALRRDITQWAQPLRPRYEAQYGLEQFYWEPVGYMVVRLSSFRAAVRKLMLDLGFLERKVEEYIAYWSSRLDELKPEYVEIRALYHPSTTYGTSISIEKVGADDAGCEGKTTRLLLGFNPVHGALDPREVLSMTLPAMREIRKRSTQQFRLGGHDSTSEAVKVVKIFEAGGMVIRDNRPEQHTAKQASGNGRRPENDDTKSIGSVSEDRYWICCNPRNYESHGKVGVSMTLGTCVECPHCRCPQCVVSGGLKMGSLGGQAVHSVNPVEKYAVTIGGADGTRFDL